MSAVRFIKRNVAVAIKLPVAIILDVLFIARYDATGRVLKEHKRQAERDKWRDTVDELKKW